MSHFSKVQNIRRAAEPIQPVYIDRNCVSCDKGILMCSSKIKYQDVEQN